MEYLKEWEIISEEDFNKIENGKTLKREEVTVLSDTYTSINVEEFKKVIHGDIVMLDYQSYTINGSGYTHRFFYGEDYDTLSDHDQDIKGYISENDKIYKYISDEIVNSTNPVTYQNIEEETDIITITYGVPINKKTKRRRKNTKK